MSGWKKIKLIRCIGIILFILTPLFGAILFCLKDGRFINDVYMPLGGWSDEITYYKQIEGILSHGMPKGYFGYNQSSALYGPLGVWGIVPLIPYVVWGFFFGWNYTSPIYANIFFCVIGFLVIWLILKPAVKDLVMFSFFWVLCHFINRYVLSGVVEASVAMQLMIVVSCGIYLLSNKIREQAGRDFTVQKDRVVLIVCVIMICILTLARPYFAVLYLIPFWRLAKDRKWVGCAILPLVAIMVLVLFFVNSYYFCSTYFSNILSFGTLKEAGIGGVVGLVTGNLIEIAKLIWYAIRYHDSVGWYYLLLFLELAVMAVKCVVCLIKKERVPIMFIITLVGNGLILISFMLIYNLTVGARHILPIVVANVIILIVESHWIWGTVLGVLCGLSVLLMGEFLDIPYRNELYSEYMDQVEMRFAEAVQVSEELSYENVVAMPTADTDRENPEKKVCTYYGLMFALPSGVGVSLDFEDFYEDPGNIKAGYVLVHPQGRIREMLEEMGMECVIEEEEYFLYKKSDDSF